MIGLDTNVIVRLLVADDQEQLARAQRLVASQKVVILLTVLLETEWVLRSLYGMKPGRIADAVEHLAGFPNVSLEKSEAALSALAALRAGIDFADALHLYSASEAGLVAFGTFDKTFVRRSARMHGTIPVVSV